MNLRETVIQEMQQTFGDDQRRIAHALAVLGHAEAIFAGERALGRPADAEVVAAAAVLHDIGIHAAEAKHGSSAGHWQELEGPPIARAILEPLAVQEPTIDHVCRIVANHHSARDIDTQEFRIVFDADWLVNIPDEFPRADRPTLERLIDRVFKTQTGKRRARELFTERKTQ